ncbi:hypothetical protein Trydic_g19924 [Trypoxylus dichotomus]
MQLFDYFPLYKSSNNVQLFLSRPIAKSSNQSTPKSVTLPTLRKLLLPDPPTRFAVIHHYLINTTGRGIYTHLLGLLNSQISSLVETHGSSVGALRSSAVARVGQAVNVAVERFVTVGETIADDYPEVRDGMYEACKEARQAGESLQIFLLR